MNKPYKFWNTPRVIAILTTLGVSSTIVGGIVFRMFQLPWQDGTVTGLVLWALLTVAGYIIFKVLIRVIQRRFNDGNS